MQMTHTKQMLKYGNDAKLADYANVIKIDKTGK